MFNSRSTVLQDVFPCRTCSLANSLCSCVHTCVRHIKVTTVVSWVNIITYLILTFFSRGLVRCFVWFKRVAYLAYIVAQCSWQIGPTIVLKFSGPTIVLTFCCHMIMLTFCGRILHFKWLCRSWEILFFFFLHVRVKTDTAWSLVKPNKSFPPFIKFSSQTEAVSSCWTHSSWHTMHAWKHLKLCCL